MSYLCTYGKEDMREERKGQSCMCLAPFSSSWHLYNVEKRGTRMHAALDLKSISLSSILTTAVTTDGAETTACWEKKNRERGKEKGKRWPFFLYLPRSWNTWRVYLFVSQSREKKHKLRNRMARCVEYLCVGHDLYIYPRNDEAIVTKRILNSHNFTSSEMEGKIISKWWISQTRMGMRWKKEKSKRMLWELCE